MWRSEDNLKGFVLSSALWMPGLSSACWAWHQRLHSLNQLTCPAYVFDSAVEASAHAGHSATQLHISSLCDYTPFFI